MYKHEPNLSLAHLGPACRIYQVIRYKGFQTKIDFAAHMGWTKQHLNTLLRGSSIGLSAVSAILEKFPDISARWLLFGEGVMVDLTHHEKAIHDWYVLAPYAHVMTPEERKRIDSGLGYDLEDVGRWMSLALDFKHECEDRFFCPEEDENEG